MDVDSASGTQQTTPPEAKITDVGEHSEAQEEDITAEVRVRRVASAIQINGYFSANRGRAPRRATAPPRLPRRRRRSFLANEKVKF